MARSKLPRVTAEVANPGGSMPHMVAETVNYARSKSKQMCKVLYELATDECASAKDRIRAAEVLLDRGLGKAPVVTYSFNEQRTDNRAEVMELARAVLSMVNQDVAALSEPVEDAEFEDDDESG